HTVTLSGSIDIVDPTPTTPDRAFRTRSNAFTRTVTSSATGTTRSVVENGVRSVVGSADQIQLLDTTQTDYTYGSGATASHARKWLATFAADQAGSIQMGSRLPSGKWTISGSSTFTSGTDSYSLSVTTSDPLHYNTSCSVEPRFDSGTLTAVVTKGTASSSPRARSARGRAMSWPWAATVPCTRWRTACCTRPGRSGRSTVRPSWASCRSAPETTSPSWWACTGMPRCTPCSASSPRAPSRSTWGACSTSTS